MYYNKLQKLHKEMKSDLFLGRDKPYLFRAVSVDNASLRKQTEGRTDGWTKKLINHYTT